MAAGDQGGEGLVTWGRLLAEATAQLGAGGVEQPGAEARWLVAEACGLDGAELVLELGQPAPRRGVAQLDAMVARRLAGEPVQYVLGHWSFRTLDLLVDRRVLIPRPETEVVVGRALAELDRAVAARAGAAGPGGGPPLVADLGTGSGAIALSVAAERPRARVWATDVDAAALAVATANLAGLGRPASRVSLARGRWYEALPAELAGRLDLVVSNPPYVGAGEGLPPEVAGWEPRGALVAGPEGTEDLVELVAGAPAWLAPHGALVLELAPGQAAPMAEAARAAGFAHVEVAPDLVGRPRALVARTPPPPPDPRPHPHPPRTGVPTSADR